MVPLEGAADNSSQSESPPASSPTTGVYVAAAPPVIGSLDAALPAGSGLGTDAAKLAAAAAAATAPTVLSTKWGVEKKKEVKGLRRQFLDLPEDTAEEGRFLMMAALVGVITGTAGEKLETGKFHSCSR